MTGAGMDVAWDWVSEVLSRLAAFGGVTPQWLVGESIKEGVLWALGLAVTLGWGLLAWLLWRATIRPLAMRWRARRLRLGKGESFLVVVCLLADDRDGVLRRQIDAALRPGGEEPRASGRPLRVAALPVEVGGSKGEGRAARWLARSGADVLVWGESLDGRSDARVRLLGASGRDGPSAMREVNFLTERPRFRADVAETVAVEVGLRAERILWDPGRADMAAMRGLASRVARLVADPETELTESAREGLRARLDALHLELSRRAERAGDWDDAIAWARRRVEALGPRRGRGAEAAWCDAALDLATHVRRRAWAGASDELIEEGWDLAEAARRSAADRLHEDQRRRALLLRAWIAFRAWQAHQDADRRERVADAERDLEEATPPAAEAARGFKAERLAFRLLWWGISHAPKAVDVGSMDPDWPERAWERLEGWRLDPDILVETARRIADATFEAGDVAKEPALWQAALALPDKVARRLTQDLPVARSALACAAAETGAIAWSSGRLGSKTTPEKRLEAAQAVLEQATVAARSLTAVPAAYRLSWAGHSALSRALEKLAIERRDEGLFREAVVQADLAWMVAKTHMNWHWRGSRQHAAVVRNNMSNRLNVPDPALEAIAILAGSLRLSAWEHYVLAYAHYVVGKAVLWGDGSLAEGLPSLAELANYVGQARIIASASRAYALKEKSVDQQLIGSLDELLDNLAMVDARLALAEEAEAAGRKSPVEPPSPDPPTRSIASLSSRNPFVPGPASDDPNNPFTPSWASR